MNDLLDRIAVNTFDDYDPAVVVDAANALLPRGKESVLAEVEEYVREFRPGKETSGILWLLRALFDVSPPLHFPPIQLGRLSVPVPPDPLALPRFPIMLVADVPLLLVRGYDLAGAPQPFGGELAFVRDHAVFRKTPVTPDASVAEARFLRDWMMAYGASPAGDELEFIRMQIGRLRKSAG